MTLDFCSLYVDPMSVNLLKNLSQAGGKRLLCLEVNPPRGVNSEQIFSRLDNNLAGIDFLNVTDCALARMKLAALPFAAILKQRYSIEPLVNISCRDRNLIALQSDLLAGWALGVRSIVALTGDAVTVGDSPDRKGVFEVNSIGLLNAIATLNSGKDLAGNDLMGSPEYVPGVVVNPNARNRAAEIKRLKRKGDAGARYALSQPAYDIPIAVEFLKEAQDSGVSVFLGLLPFKTKQAAHNMNNIPGIKMCESLLKQVDEFSGEDLSELSIDHCLKLVEACGPYVAGFHVISGTTPKLALQLAHRVAVHLGKIG